MGMGEKGVGVKKGGDKGGVGGEEGETSGDEGIGKGEGRGTGGGVSLANAQSRNVSLISKNVLFMSEYARSRVHFVRGPRWYAESVIMPFDTTFRSANQAHRIQPAVIPAPPVLDPLTRLVSRLTLYPILDFNRC